MQYLGNMEIIDNEGHIWKIYGITFGDEEIMIDCEMVNFGKQVMCSRIGDTVKEEKMWYTHSFSTVFEYQEVKLDENNIIVDITF
ncbi:MAG: hypothetical protein [Bacteriophage sp.]|nr:MAG: hypothetical protein [Bacteriophage sp.]